jgi:carbon-monoxide dehydrogenase medium subunit
MPFELQTPENASEALKLVSPSLHRSVAILAGGTDLLLDIDEARVDPRFVVSLRQLPWRELSVTKSGVMIGSTLPLRALELHPRIRLDSPGLWKAVRAVGSVALRHRATVGGNLGRASPASDLIPILLAFDASVTLVGLGGKRSVSVGDFVQGPRQTTLSPGELIRSVEIPRLGPSDYVWQRVRPANDVSQVGVAVACLDVQPFWRVALGGVWPASKRLPEAEEVLTTPTPSDLAIELASQQAARLAPFVTDKRATEAYRRRLVGTLTRRAIRETMAQVRAKTGTRRHGGRER